MQKTLAPQLDLPITLHHHVIVLAAKIVLATGVGFRLAFFFINLIFRAEFVSSEWSIALLLAIIIIVLTVLADIYLYVWWKQNIYRFDDKKVTHTQGVFWRKRRTVRFPTLDVFKMKQSFLGRIFNYGSIVLRSTETEKEITLQHIPDPQKYVEIIRQLMPKAEQF
jgi:uncharacterized membrane protein YdbT with pleckstrin-like domain